MSTKDKTAITVTVPKVKVTARYARYGLADRGESHGIILPDLYLPKADAPDAVVVTITAAS